MRIASPDSSFGHPVTEGRVEVALAANKPVFHDVDVRRVRQIFFGLLLSITKWLCLTIFFAPWVAATHYNSLIWPVCAYTNSAKHSGSESCKGSQARLEPRSCFDAALPYHHVSRPASWISRAAFGCSNMGWRPVEGFGGSPFG